MRKGILGDHLYGAEVIRSSFLPVQDKEGVWHHWISLTPKQYFVSEALWEKIKENGAIKSEVPV